ncbi:MAG TPA: M20 family metallo-hydrolase [Elusimicrobiales bacterium]|nr:M20 family metallo-hydrolase [Elusimicrobiales bacterium]
MQNKIFKKIDSQLDCAVKLQENLTAIAAIGPSNGGDGEFEKANYLESELKKLKFDEIKRIDAPDENVKSGVRPNLIARYKGENSDRTFWIMTHIDVVPAGNLELWKTDPFKVHREGNKLYGRGVEDNQQGMIASIVAVKSMMDEGYRPPFDIALLFVADEETGSKYGIQYLLKNNPKLFSKKDVFLVPDGGNAKGNSIEIAEKSILRLKFTVIGKQCHAATPTSGINPVNASSKLVCKLSSLYQEYDLKNDIFDIPTSTFEPTIRKGHTASPNTIPEKDIFYFDCRLIPAYDLNKVMSSIKSIVKQIEQETKTKIEIETDRRVQVPPPLPLDSEIISLAKNAVKAACNIDAFPVGISGGSAAKYINEKGFQAVLYGKVHRLGHCPNECSTLDNLMDESKIMAHVAFNVKPVKKKVSCLKK